MCTDELYASLRRAFLLPFPFSSFFFLLPLLINDYRAARNWFVWTIDPAAWNFSSYRRARSTKSSAIRVRFLPFYYCYLFANIESLWFICLLTHIQNPLGKRLEAQSVSTRDPPKDYTKSWKKIDRPAVAVAEFTKAIDTIKLAVKDATRTYEKEADDVWYLQPERQVLREITAPGNRYDYGEVHKLVKYRTMRVVFLPTS